MSTTKSVSILLLGLYALLLCLPGQAQQQQQQQNDGNIQMSEDVAAVFDPSSADGYQRRYTINVAAKSEECYFVSGVKLGQTLNFHFMVSRNGWKSGESSYAVRFQPFRLAAYRRNFFIIIFLRE